MSPVPPGTHGGCRKIPVEDSRYRLSQNLHNAYPLETPAALWNMDHCLPGTLLLKIPVVKI